MNTLHLTLLVAAIAFAVLFAFSRKWAIAYGRMVILLGVGSVILLPFVWLICAAFKDTSVLNEYAFLPPVSKISSSTINLDSFRTLFTDKDTVQGPVSFWRYIWNSLFLATAGTSISLIFSSMGGYALAKYKFPGRSSLLTYMLASMTILAWCCWLPISR